MEELQRLLKEYDKKSHLVMCVDSFVLEDVNRDFINDFKSLEDLKKFLHNEINNRYIYLIRHKKTFITHRCFRCNQKAIKFISNNPNMMVSKLEIS